MMETNPAQSLIDRIEGPSEPMTPEVRARGYYNQPVWKRIVVIAAGPAMNLLVAFLLLFGLSFAAEEPDGPGLEVAEVRQGSPAEGNLESEDQIVSVDGVAADNLDAEDLAERLRREINSHTCDGEPAEGCVADHPGAHRRRARWAPRHRRRQARVLRGRGAQPGRLRLPADRLRGRQPLSRGGRGPLARLHVAGDQRDGDRVRDIFERSDELSGSVGSYEVTRQAFTFDAERALLFLAVISLSLAIINLFPFLPLDGGHIFWSLVEKVRGKPVPYSTMERGAALGFVLVLMLFFLGLTNDINRLTGEGFDVR